MLWLSRCTPRASLACASLSLVLALGCHTRIPRPVPKEAPLPPPAAEVEVADPVLQPAPPGEAELALEAARAAEQRGDHAAAADLYALSARTAFEPSQQADALYSLALLHAGAGDPVRDLVLARSELQQLLEVFPGHSRARESRLMIVLLDELDATRSQAASLQGQADSARGEATTLRAELEKKDQELKNIKQVLLQRKP